MDYHQRFHREQMHIGNVFKNELNVELKGGAESKIHIYIQVFIQLLCSALKIVLKAIPQNFQLSPYNSFLTLIAFSKLNRFLNAISLLYKKNILRLFF